MVSLSSSQITQDVIATGSSDGLIRVVQIHPSKFLGVIAAHGTSSVDQESGDVEDQVQVNSEGFPVERMKLDRNKKWLGSISHDELLKLTDVEGALEGSEGESEEDAEEGDNQEQSEIEDEADGEDKNDSDKEDDEDEGSVVGSDEDVAQVAVEPDSDSDSAPPPTHLEPQQSKKRKKKELKREEKKRRKGEGPTSSFFADL